MMFKVLIVLLFCFGCSIKYDPIVAGDVVVCNIIKHPEAKDQWFFIGKVKLKIGPNLYFENVTLQPDGKLESFVYISSGHCDPYNHKEAN